LLVEDNPTDVFVIKEVLDGCGPDLDVHLVTNGHAALLYLQELDRDQKVPPPALVLLDLNLPKVTGIEVLRALRSSSRCSGIPVIVVTSSSADADRSAAQQLGAAGYFQKPTELAAYMELAGLIKRVLDTQEKS
jgi:two-component system, chemotaxis family, response regulator Rcp1